MTYRTIAARTLTAGLGFGMAAWCFAPRSSPGQGTLHRAAWLMPAVAMPEPIARAADPDAPPFQSVFPAGQPSSRPPVESSPFASVMLPSVMPEGSTKAVQPSPKKNEPTMVGRAWNNVVGAVSGPPKSSANAPHARPVSWQGQPVNSFRMAGRPMASPVTAAPRGYAAPPAYRWYGWGTTIPGQNVYAPDGQTYRTGSTQWYVSTGATPGAIPHTGFVVSGPVTSGAEPPIYSEPPLARGTQPPAGSGTIGRSTPRSEATVTVAPPVAASSSSPAVLPAMVPSGPVVRNTPGGAGHGSSGTVLPTVPVTSGVPSPDSSPRPEPPTGEPEPQWQPARVPSAMVEPRSGPGVTEVRAEYRFSPEEVERSAIAVPLVPKTSPGSDEILKLEREVREVCRSFVTVTELVSSGPGKVVVRYIAPSEAAAAEAVQGVRQVPGLKPYVVEFDGKVMSK